jgi:hypothetical protein
MSTKGKRNRFRKIDPSDIGLSFGYAAPPSEWQMNSQVREEENDELKQQMREFKSRLNSQPVPVAQCPRCRKLWEMLPGCPLLREGRTKIKPDLECPTFDCGSEYDANILKKINQLESTLMIDGAASFPAERNRELTNLYTRLREASQMRDACRGYLRLKE